MDNYKKLFSESNIIISRLKHLLEEENIVCIVKSDKLPGYEITHHTSELFVDVEKFDRANEILAAYQAEINQ